MLKTLTFLGLAGSLGAAAYVDLSRPDPAPARQQVATTAPAQIDPAPRFQGPGPPAGPHDGSPAAISYAAACPGWKFWSVTNPELGVSMFTGRVITPDPAKPQESYEQTAPAFGAAVWAYGPGGQGGPQPGTSGWERRGADSGGELWRLRSPAYALPRP